MKADEDWVSEVILGREQRGSVISLPSSLPFLMVLAWGSGLNRGYIIKHPWSSCVLPVISAAFFLARWSDRIFRAAWNHLWSQAFPFLTWDSGEIPVSQLLCSNSLLAKGKAVSNSLECLHSYRMESNYINGHFLKVALQLNVKFTHSHPALSLCRGDQGQQSASVINSIQKAETK